MVSTRPGVPVKVWYGVISAGELPKRVAGRELEVRTAADAGISQDL